MKALVTGAAGFIGSNLCLELAESGCSVVGIDSFLTGHFENLGNFPGDLVAADLCEPASWKDKVEGVDVVFHQAAITDTTEMDQNKMMRANVEAFRSLLSWAAEQGVRKVVYATSAGVYGDNPVPMKEADSPKPLNIYAFSKMVMESLAKEFAAARPKMSIVGLRYFNVFGPRERFKGKAASMIWQLAQQMRAGRRPRIFEHGEQYRDFIYVRDVVRANLLAQKAPSGVYNVCTGTRTTFNQVIEILNGVLGTRLAPDYFKNPYSFYQNETLGNPKAAEKALKFKAEYSVEEAILEYFGQGRGAPVGV
ncbi:MAG: NAD-dependent epimerase/dehydratase family protein [Elusimicrobia bacterium]|nr:NAD-dependent epimerase/dehydratase family protein [Elusimicrobiota bacterium]